MTIEPSAFLQKVRVINEEENEVDSDDEQMKKLFSRVLRKLTNEKCRDFPGGNSGGSNTRVIKGLFIRLAGLLN